MIFYILLPILSWAAEYQCSVPANAGLKEIIFRSPEKNRGEITYVFNSGLISRPHLCIGHGAYHADYRRSRSFLCIGPSVLAESSMSSVLISEDGNGNEIVSLQFLVKGEKEFREFSPLGPSKDCEKR